MQVAFICRYGHQDVHAILGIKRALTPLERALFVRALQEHWDAEVRPRAELGLPPSED